MHEIRSSNTFERKLEGFSDKQRKTIFQNTGAIQLTEGCSGGCIDCGLGALVGVRDYISVKTLENLMNNQGKKFKNLRTLYFASDPFDYQFDGVTYPFIHKMVAASTGRYLDVHTSAPRGSEKEVIRAISQNNILEISKDNTDYKFINVLSVMKSNYDRLQRFFSQMEGFRDEDQIKTTFSTDNENHIILTDNELKKMTDNSDIYIYGQKSKDNNTIYMIKTRSNEYVASIGTPVKFVDIIKSKIRKEELANSLGMFGIRFSNDVCVYNFYSQDLPKDQMHAYRLGEHFKDSLSDRSLSCFHGVVLTPSGAYNYQTVSVSRENPLGLIKTEIHPEAFEVIPFRYIVNGDNYSKSFLELGTRRIKGDSWIKDNFNKTEKYFTARSFFT